MQKNFVRTDLAEEAHSLRLRDGSTVEGVTLEKAFFHTLPATRLEVLNDKGAEIIGKSTGVYYTLEIDGYLNRREASFECTANAVSDILRKLLPGNAKKFLIACLGNRHITPDALGACVADGLIVTRHLKSSMPEQFAAFSDVAVLRTGVLGTTGVESAEAVKSICSTVEPDCVIAVDALACGELDRLCRNIQICDSGISPGSGVGNNRRALDRATLGVPVIAMGIPTVIDAAAFTEDEAAKGLFVTPRNIDELVRSSSKALAYGIDLALHRDLSVADVDMLVE